MNFGMMKIKKSFQISNVVGYESMVWNESTLKSFDQLSNDGINFIFKNE